MTDRHTQYLAVTLIFMAACAISVGEHFNWIHLTDFANLFGGAGVGILTGNKMASVANNAGGVITVNDKGSQTPGEEPLPYMHTP